MIQRLRVSRQESGAVEIAVRGEFAGVMQAAAPVERCLVECYGLPKAPKTQTASEPGRPGADLSLVAGAGFEPAAFRL